MAGQNRSSYARANSSANRGLIGFFRGAFILLVALTLSFGLGFFVIARMLPPSTGDSPTSNGAVGGPNSGASSSAHSEQTPQRAARPSGSAQITSKPAPVPPDGPELLPDNNVQEPSKLGATSGNEGANGPAGAEASTIKPTGGDQIGDNSVHGTDPSGDAGNVDSSGQRRSRRSRTSDTDSGLVQSAGSLDGEHSKASDSSSDRPATTTPRGKSGLYRVQIGVYSTREKAEEMIRSAADKGITTTLHVITRDGRTLYRVQQSSHRDRAKAEHDRQKLLDAGFDATIINPS